MRGTRLAPALACVVLLASASSASAVTRYASPAGATSGTCAVASPCELEYAVETVAGAGDEVRIGSGTYSIDSTIVAGSSKILRGDGATRPRLVGGVALGGAPVTIQGGASISNLRIESQNASPALDLDGVGATLELYSSGGTAARLRGSSELTTAIVSTPAAGAAALSLTDGLLTGATVRHATIVATGAGSTGLDASGLNLLGIGAPTVVSSIVKGTTTDVAGGLLNAVNLDYSAYRFASSTGAAANDGTNLNDAALLVNPTGGDFQQQSGSATVNKGSNPDAAAVDLAGNPRSIDGTPDIGALELPVPPDASTGAATSVTSTTANIAGTVATHASATDFRFIWGTSNPPVTGGSLRSLPGSAAGGNYSENVTGLKPGTTYHYRVVATNPWGTTEGAVASFATPSVAPTATTDAASLVAATSACLSSTVNAGGAATTVEFQWGADTSYGSSTGSQPVDPGTSDVSPVADLSGLLPSTHYHYRVVATNSNGTVYGADRTFTTAPARPDVVTGIATSITRDRADLAATVGTGGADTSYEFEYGTTAGYGLTTASGTVASVNTSAQVTATLTGLEPGVKYHYRVVARNVVATTVGSDMTFTTGPAPATDAPTEKPVDPQGGPVQADGLRVPDPAPPVGESANAAPSSGTVRVRIPGSNQYVELTEGAAIPMGSLVDASMGEVVITSASDSRGGTQTAAFTGSAFKLVQKKAAKPITDVILTGGTLSDCTPPPLTKIGEVQAAGRRKWSRRRLWGNGHGRFRTRGRHGTATVRGTWWLTEDRCDGTLVRVKRGLVEVRDLARRKTVLVPAGEDYFAKSLVASKAAAKKSRTKRRR